MIKVNYTELDGPYGPAMRLEAAGHAGYAPAGQDIVCAGVSTLMQALVSLLAGEENAHSDAFDEPDGPRLTVTAARPCTAWVEGAFELAKAGFALLAERYPDNVRFADRSARGKQEMMDLQLFADGGEAAAPALSAAQEQQAVASGTMKPGEKADAKQETTAPEGEKEVKETEPVKAEEGQEQEPPRPALPKRFPGSQAVDALHRRWAAEEAMMRRAVPEFSLQKELADPEMRRLMQLPGMRMGDAYRLAHYNDALRQTAQTVEQAVLAEKHGADYLGVGAVFPTGSKDDADDVSYETLKAICGAVSIPVVAIGGITQENVAKLAGSGICGVAVISAIYAAKNIQQASADLKAATEKMLHD